MTTSQITINIYRHNGMWAYAAIVGSEHDHSDTLPDAESEADAREAVATMWPSAEVVRVDDVDDDTVAYSLPEEE